MGSGEADRAFAGQRHPELRVRLLDRLRKDADLFQDGGGGGHRVGAAVVVGLADAQHLVERGPVAGLAEQLHGLGVVPLGVGGRDGEVLTVVGERGLGPRLQDELERFFVGRAVPLLVLDRGAVVAAQGLVLARLVAAPDAAFESTVADDVEDGGLLGEADRVPPGDDVGVLAQPDTVGLGRHGGLDHHRVGAELGALGLEVVLAQPEVVEAELVGQDALPHLVAHDPLVARVHIRERAGWQDHVGRGSLQRQVGRAVVEDPYFKHGILSSPRCWPGYRPGWRRSISGRATLGGRQIAGAEDRMC